MATAQALGTAAGSEREITRARRAIVNPRPVRLAGVLGPSTKAPGTFVQRVEMGGVSSLSVLVKISSIAGAWTADVFGMTQPATDDDTDGAERNGRQATQLALINGINELADFVPAGEQFVEIQIVVPGGGSGDIDWTEVLGQ